MTDELGQVIVDYDYDPAGRLSRKTLGNGVFTTYTYNSAGQVTQLVNSRADSNVLSSFSYTYDASGRRSSMTVARGYAMAASQMDARPHPGPLPQERENMATVSADLDALFAGSALSPLEPPETATAPGASNSTTTPAGSSLSSGERAGVRASQSPLILAASSSGDGTFTYGYDPLGQLTSVTYPNSRVVNYAYDAAGNRTQVTDNGVPATYAANTLNQYTSAGAATFGYDLDGNLTNKTESATNTIYTYDIENRLIGVATPTDNWTYTYDAFGNRITATHNGQTTRYVIDPTGLGNVAAEYNGGGSLIARYEHGFGLLARTDAAGDPAFYTFSAIGHTSELTGPSGAVANAYAYDPFGLSLAKAETIPNPFEFVGEFGVMNEGNGLEFMRMRHYRPAEGSFSQQDPTGLRRTANLYLYGWNNPVSFHDPKGTSPGDFDVINPRTPVHGPDYRGDPSVDRATEAERAVFLGFWGAVGFGGVLLEAGPVILTVGQNVVLKAPANPTVQGAWAFANGLMPTPPSIWPTWRQNALYLVGYYFDPIVGGLNTIVAGVFRSRDPNDKLGPSGYGSAGYLPAGGVMAYQIRFENQPSATAPAQRVTVTDTLDPNLDLSTFELTEIVFANQTLALPAGLPVRGTQTGLNHYETRLAFTVTNQTLIPLGDATAFALAPPPTNAILVEVDAHLDVPTRLLTLTLTTLDPLTGWYPENPLLGFLYPNDTNHIGEGSLSYLVRANSGAATGTTITNRANIVFDYNDPIITPLISNTIDSAPPTSSVTPLPAEAGPAILVQWSGQDDPGGSGLASYDVYVIADGTNQFRWQDRTTATSSVFRGVPGSTYSFYSIARDNIGHEESAPATPDTTVFVPTNAPVLTIVSNVMENVGQTLVLTNRLASGTPTGSFLYSFGSHAPAGATLNPTNGVLRWTPTCAQGGRTNVLTIQVTDTGNTNLTDTVSFTVIVTECVQAQAGQLVLRAGDTGRLPIHLITTASLTNLNLTLGVPAGRLTNLALEAVAPEICNNATLTPALSQPMGEGEFYALTFATCSNQWLIGTQQVAWLYVTAVSNQHSTFVPVTLTDLLGTQPDGTTVSNLFAQAGRVVVVGEEPLLEAFRSTNGLVQTVLYAPVGATVRVEWASQLPAGPAGWNSLTQTNLTTLSTLLPPIPANTPMRFFRAVRQ